MLTNADSATITAVNSNFHQTTPPKSPSSPTGILQRYEVQQLLDAGFSKLDDNILIQQENFCTSSQQLEIITNPLDADLLTIRCPCCRSAQEKLICLNCLCTNVLQIGKINNELRRLKQSKTAICQLIETALIDEIAFESDFRLIKRSIDELKTRIAWKKDRIGRLRQRIANMEGQGQRNQRNVILLEKKMVSHADRINRTNSKIQDILNSKAQIRLKLNERITQVCRFLFQIFRLEKQKFGDNEHVPAWTRQTKVQRTTYLLNNCHCFDRLVLLSNLFSNQTKNEHFNQSMPQTTLNCSHCQPSSASSLAILTHAAQFTELLAHLLDVHLPYPQIHREMMLLMLPSTTSCSTGTVADSLSPLEMAFRQQLFKLDYSTLLLCLSQSVPPEGCEFLTSPLSNLHSLVMYIQCGKVYECVPRLDQRLHQQVCEQFAAAQPNGRVISQFTLDNVENDWVRVHCSS